MMIPNDFRGEAVSRSTTIFQQCADLLSAEVALCRALVRVEAAGNGFLNEVAPPHLRPSQAPLTWGRRQKILCERRVFSNYSGRRFDKTNPGVSARSMGGYVGGAGEHKRLELMIELDREAAFKAISMGAGQTMGFNAERCGYGDAEAMFSAYADSEDAQILGMASFIKSDTSLLRKFRGKNFQGFAAGYNGQAYAVNQYDLRLATEYAAAVAEAQNGAKPMDQQRQQVRLAQVVLNLQGWEPALVTDGLWGPRTATAVRAFQANHGLSVTGQLDDRTLERLMPPIPKRRPPIRATLPAPDEGSGL